MKKVCPICGKKIDLFLPAFSWFSDEEMWEGADPGQVCPHCGKIIDRPTK